MYILGINAYHWDSSACLLKDGDVIAASEEERFNRIKHWSGMPVEAIRFCLKAANITLNQVEHVSIGHDPKAKLGRKIAFGLSNAISIDFIKKRLERTNSFEGILQSIEKGLDAPGTLSNSRLHWVEHHRSHLASSFFASSFKEAALLSLDGFGDFTSTMRGHGRDNGFTIIDSVSYPHSIGMFYTALTQFLGFPEVGDEYKVMGLAPYGKPVYRDQLSKIVHLKTGGSFSLERKYFSYFRTGAVMEMRNSKPFIGSIFSNELTTLLGAPRATNDPLRQQHMDIAASIQAYTEEIIFHIALDLKKRTGLPYLCLAGGVAQNSVANGKIGKACGYESIYVPPAGHDAGLSIGSALYVYNQVLGNPRAKPMLSGYTGSSFTNAEIVRVLNNKNISFREIPDAELFEVVTKKLLDEGVVGWFNGKAEFGPRALGARSILADPRNPNAKELLNLKIKRRESFRPFAPSILKEYVSEYFEGTDDVPFMEKVFPIRPEKRGLIPAVTHVDGTGRLQTVDREVSPRYYGLIENFRQKTGIPILLNTSFNENEPIVNTPEEALDCFLRTKMDMLVLQNCVITRQS